MKKPIFFLLAILLSLFSLSACVKNQNTDANGNTITPDTQNINDTNYQAMMREQSARAAAISAGHGGGGRR